MKIETAAATWPAGPPTVANLSHTWDFSSSPPNGFLSSNGIVTGTFAIGATTLLPAVTGDYGASGTRWQLSFDLNFFSGNFTDAWLHFRYQDDSHNGWRFPLQTGFPQNQ